MNKPRHECLAKEILCSVVYSLNRVSIISGQDQFKEVRIGLLNGLAVAATCGIGVYIWSQSLGLVAVICMSMVLAMVAAGFAGAIVPILLVRMGQDPAQSSSIILTTVSDVAGFFSFLGIATLMMRYL